MQQQHHELKASDRREIKVSETFEMIVNVNKQ